LDHANGDRITAKNPAMAEKARRSMDPLRT